MRHKCKKLFIIIIIIIIKNQAKPKEPWKLTYTQRNCRIFNNMCNIIYLLLLYRLRENLDRLNVLEEEKNSMSSYAQELQSNINDLKAQKELTEKELRVS